MAPKLNLSVALAWLFNTKETVGMQAELLLHIVCSPRQQSSKNSRPLFIVDVVLIVVIVAVVTGGHGFF
eukprot:scaffold117065_cov32-Tisochrysis_lutea.AAC.1